MLSNARYIDPLTFLSLHLLSSPPPLFLLSLYPLFLLSLSLLLLFLTLLSQYLTPIVIVRIITIHAQSSLTQDHTRTRSSFTMLWTEEWATHSPMTHLPTCPTTQVYTLSPSLLPYLQPAFCSFFCFIFFFYFTSRFFSPFPLLPLLPPFPYSF